MKLIERTERYTDVDQKDLEYFGEQRTKVNDEGMIISEIEWYKNLYGSYEVKVRYEKEVPICNFIRENI